MDPVNEALEKAGLTLDDIHQVELLGGGIRVPKVTQYLEEGMPGKELAVHLNGDEAMCFGTAFIGSNSTTSFKVRKVLLTQNPTFDAKLVISPLEAAKGLTEDEQRAEGIEDADLITYTQEMRLFNTSDFFGKSKALTMNYDVDMKLEVFKLPAGAELDSPEMELLDTFTITDVKKSFDHEMEKRQKDAEREAKKKQDAKNETEGEGDKKEATEDEEAALIEKPKMRISLEMGRSGLFKLSKATMGSTHATTDRVKKPFELTDDAIKAAKARLKAYKKRDEDKQRNDVSRNDFESLVYAVRSWLREDENEPYVAEEERDEKIGYLNEMEDWLYEDGADANYTVLEAKTKELTKEFDKYTARKTLHESLDALVTDTKASVEKVRAKVATLSALEEKAFIAEEEWNDVLDTATEVEQWVDESLEKQAALSKSEEPAFDQEAMEKKVAKLTKLFKKVSTKRPPKPKKEEKPKEEEKEDFAA